MSVLVTCPMTTWQHRVRHMTWNAKIRPVTIVVSKQDTGYADTPQPFGIRC